MCVNDFVAGGLVAGSDLISENDLVSGNDV